MKRLLFCCAFLFSLCLVAAPTPKLIFAKQEGGKIIFENPVPRKASVIMEYQLNQKEARAVTFGADAKVRHDVKEFQAILRVDFIYNDNTLQQWVNIGLPLSNDFRKSSRTYMPKKPVKTAILYVMFNAAGSAEVTNVFLKEQKTNPVPAPYPYATGAEPEKLGKLKEFRRDLCLTTDLTRSAVIVPDTAAGKRWAEAIRKAVRTDIPVVPAAQYDRAMKLDRNLIVVGNRDNNTVIDHFYLMHKVLLDCYYPGKGGYTVRTLHNPFGDKHNVVFAGGSDDAGTDAAVRQLVKRIRESKGLLPWTQDIQLAPELKAPLSANAVPLWEESRGYGSRGYFGWQSFSKNMMVYYMTGEKRYLDEFIRLAFHAKPDELFKIDDESHHHLPDPMLEPYHYRWVMTPVLWDLVEESPHLSEADRLRVTAKLYEMLKYRISKQYWYSIANHRTRWDYLPNRHLSWEAVTVWATANYIARHYDCYEGKQGLFLSGNMLYPVDDFASLKTGSCFWYNTYIQPFFVYAAMAKGRNAIGLPALRHLASGLTAFADLRPGDWSQLYSSIAFLRLAGHLVQDQGMYHLAELQNIPEVPFRAGFSFLTANPYSRNFFAETSGKFFTYAADVRGAHWFEDSPFPKEEVVEWLTWREKPADHGDLLVLCPYPGNASREPFHNYALHTLRLGNDLLLSGFRTQLELFANGTTPGKEARYGRITGKDIVGKDTIIIRGEVRNYNGFDWKRTILLRQNRFLLLLDEVVPLAAYKDSEIKNRLQLCGSVRKSGDDFTVVSPTPVRQDKDRLYTKVNAGKIIEYNPSAPKPYRSDYAGFEGVKPGMTLQIPFVMPETADAGVFLQIGSHVERRADLRIKLDGRTVVEKYHPITSDRAINRVSLGKHHLSAGKHCVTVEIVSVDPGFPDTTIAAIGDLEISRDFSIPAPSIWTVASSSRDRSELDGGTVNFHTYSSGDQPMRSATLIRRGKPDQNGSSAQDMGVGWTKLQLPETAWLRTSKDGFELLEKDRKTLIPASGKITVLTAEAFPQGLRAGDAAKAVETTVPYCNPVWEQCLSPSPICLASPVGDGLAFVQNNKLILLKKGGVVERIYTVKAPIGDFCYYAPRDMFLVGSKDELLNAIDRKSGKVLWTFTSEMNDVLKASSAFYGMKCSVPGVSGVRVFELNNKPVIFAGSTGTLELVDLDGKLLSRNFHGSGGYLDIFTELPGKGVIGVRHASTPETYLTTPDLKTRNFGMTLDSNGVHMGSYGFGCVSHNNTTTAKLHKDGPWKIISTFHGTMTRLGIWDANGKLERDVSFGAGMGKGGGYGAISLGKSSMQDLCVEDLDGDGVKEIILAYNRRIITVFDPELKLIRLIRLEENPCTVTAVNGLIVVGCFNGDLLWFTGDGKPVKKAKLPGAVSFLQIHGDTLYAGSGQGVLAAFRIVK